MCRVSLQPRNNCSEHYAPAADHHAMQCAFLLLSRRLPHILRYQCEWRRQAPIYSRIVTKPCTYSMHICVRVSNSMQKLSALATLRIVSPSW